MLYAITDRRLYGTNEADATARLLEQTSLWAARGVAFIQLREKDLPARAQVELARAMLQAIRQTKAATRLLVNGRPDVALASGAAGVHLPSTSQGLNAAEVRHIFSARNRQPYISISCHTMDEVQAAKSQKADCILFAPVFGKTVRPANDASAAAKQVVPGSGIERLEQACRLASPVLVFALGGVTAENAADCLAAGAAGIAAIRLVQSTAHKWAALV